MCYNPAMQVRGRQITPTKIDKVKLKAWLRAGVSGAECARRFGCSRQRVFQVAKKLGLAPHRSEPEQRYLQ